MSCKAGKREELALNTTTDNLTDIGAAPTPPAWCEPGAQATWDQLTEQHGGHPIASWYRDFGGVWIACEDRIQDGRILRSAPVIHYSEEPGLGDGIDAAGARQFAAELLSAAELLERLER